MHILCPKRECRINDCRTQPYAWKLDIGLSIVLEGAIGAFGVGSLSKVLNGANGPFFGGVRTEGLTNCFDGCWI